MMRPLNNITNTEYEHKRRIIRHFINIYIYIQWWVSSVKLNFYTEFMLSSLVPVLLTELLSVVFVPRFKLT